MQWVCFVWDGMGMVGVVERDKTPLKPGGNTPENSLRHPLADPCWRDWDGGAGDGRGHWGQGAVGVEEGERRERAVLDPHDAPPYHGN